MKSKYFRLTKAMKIYIYALIVINLIDTLLSILHVLFKSKLSDLLITINSIIFITPLLIFSLVLIIRGFVKKIHKLDLLLPILYFGSFIILGVVGYVANLGGTDPLDLTYWYNAVGIILSFIVYAVEIIIGIWLLKRDKSKSSR